MKKSLIAFVCNDCGEEFAKWQGKCSNCQLWNTLQEFKISPNEARKKNSQFEADLPVLLASVKDNLDLRISTGSSEFDRALSGGLVAGSITLLGGDPGIGKSTLMIQVAHSVAGSLYISGEESINQIALRAKRLKLNLSRINFLSQTNVGIIAKTIEKIKPRLIIIDSIQTMFDQNYPSTPGSIVQVRETALTFQNLAKSTNIPIILVGHVTKEGTVAGPKILEHLVDTVCYLEGKTDQELRIVRTIKHRFGSTNEIGLFTMTENGLISLANPSGHFIDLRMSQVPGSILTTIVDGNRPFIIEVQALSAKSVLGYPKRTASGFDPKRLELLIAILERRAGIKLYDQDIFINIVGGLTVKDRSIDLAVALAIYCSVKQHKISNQQVFFGELGLAGEIRNVYQQELRVKEVKRLNFEVFKSPTTLIAAIKLI